MNQEERKVSYKYIVYIQFDESKKLIHLDQILNMT